MEEMSQEGQEKPGSDPRLESFGLKNRSAVEKTDLRRPCLMISTLPPIQFFMQLLSTHCVSLHVWFHLIHFNDPIKSTTLSPLTTK